MPFGEIGVHKSEGGQSIARVHKGSFALIQQKKEEMLLWLREKNLGVPSHWVVVFLNDPRNRWAERARMEICFPLPENYPPDLWEGEMLFYKKIFPPEFVLSLPYVGYEDWEEVVMGYYLIEKWLEEHGCWRSGCFREIYPMNAGEGEEISIVLQVPVELETFESPLS
ncbi:MAG: GyrI-like domain-containing protein [bacterium JZ-2024 1]